MYWNCLLTTIIHKIFEANSSFHVTWRTTAKVQFLFLRDLYYWVFQKNLATCYFQSQKSFQINLNHFFFHNCKLQFIPNILVSLHEYSVVTSVAK